MTMVGHCERGHFHGNEDTEDCPWCSHPHEGFELLGAPETGDQHIPCDECDEED